MPNSNQNMVALIGRILFSIIFITSGFGKISGFAGAVGYASSAGMPMPQLAIIAAIIIELGGGLLILAGLYTRWAAYAVALFCVVSAFVFHAFWAVPEAAKMMQSINFWKNITMAGGALILAAFGPGAISLDAKRKTA